MKLNLRNYLISDTKRYGLKYSLTDNIMGWIATVIMIGGAVGVFIYINSSDQLRMLFYACIALWGIMVWLVNFIAVLKKRLTELGSDTLKNNKEVKNEIKS